MLLERIHTKQARVGVIALEYVVDTRIALKYYEPPKIACP